MSAKHRYFSKVRVGADRKCTSQRRSARRRPLLAANATPKILLAVQAYSPSAQTNAYVTSVTLPVSGTLRYGYYFGTGLKALATDQNGETTDFYSDDPLSRPTLTYLPLGAWKLTTYAGATETDAYQNPASAAPSPSCTNCLHTQANLDEWGRAISRILESDPAGATTVASNYDAQGRLTSKSNPYRCGSDPTRRVRKDRGS